MQSQQRAAAALAAGRFADEIVPIDVVMGVADKDSGRLVTRKVTVSADEGIRPDTNYEAVVEDPAGDTGRRDRRRQCQPVLRWRLGLRRDERDARRKAGLETAGHLPRLRGRGLRARRDGHRPRVRDPQAARTRRQDHRRHRPVGAQRGVRGAGALLRGQTRHSERPAQRERRRDRGRPSRTA